MVRQVSLSLALCFVAAASAHAQGAKQSWRAAKNASADRVYFDNLKTFYCGCPYTSDNDSDGSGKVSLSACGMAALVKNKNSAKRIEWEHIVPASLMPARSFACWENPEQFPKCVNAQGKVRSGRKCCESVSRTAQAMMFDLHNLASSNRAGEPVQTQRPPWGRRRQRTARSMAGM